MFRLRRELRSISGRKMSRCRSPKEEKVWLSQER